MTPSETIAGLGTRTDFIAPVPSADPARLRLTPEESALFASIGKAARISDVIQRSGHGEAKAIALLLNLRLKGAIVPARVKEPAPQSSVDAALLEEVDLPPERKKEILDLERGLDRANHFEVLGLLPGATAEEIKQSYYDASRRYHPDRYYGKNLGSYRVRIDRIFKRISEAHHVLSDPTKRAAYEKAHPELATPPPSSSGPAGGGAATLGLDAERVAERKARLMRHPYLAKTARTGEMLARARQNLERGELGVALTDLQLVLQADPRNAEVQALAADTRRKFDRQRSKEEFARGLEAERLGQPDRALTHFRQALVIDDRNASAAYKAAHALHVAGQAEEARLLSRKAVELDPQSADAHTLLAAILAEEDKKAAKKHLEEALRLSPDHTEAKKLVRKLRWPF